MKPDPDVARLNARVNQLEANFNFLIRQVEELKDAVAKMQRQTAQRR